MLRLKEELVPAVTMAKDLRDGQLAVVIEDFLDYKGRIIQKFGDDLVTIGMSSGNGWVDGANINTLKVRILEDGELLTVSNNK
jgi:CO dehydrogenase/acetyl-CoA synthase delta subunit